MYYVYVLKSLKDNSLYYGRTKDLQRRLKEHNCGRTKSLRSKLPLEIVYFEEVESIRNAIKKEKYFKSGFGRKYIKNKISRGRSSAG